MRLCSFCLAYHTYVVIAIIITIFMAGQLVRSQRRIGLLFPRVQFVSNPGTRSVLGSARKDSISDVFINLLTPLLMVKFSELSVLRPSVHRIEASYLFYFVSASARRFAEFKSCRFV
jgi:hypothetical protein